jgi:hypothetical protein
MSDSALEALYAECGNSVWRLGKTAHREKVWVRRLVESRGLRRKADNRKGLLSGVSTQVLRRAWVESHMMTGRVADRFGVSHRAAYRELRLRGIPPMKGCRTVLLTKPLLRRWCIDFGVPALAVARKIGHKGSALVETKLREYGLWPKRERFDPVTACRRGKDGRLLPLDFERPPEWNDPWPVIERREMERILAGAKARTA